MQRHIYHLIERVSHISTQCNVKTEGSEKEQKKGKSNITYESICTGIINSIKLRKKYYSQVDAKEKEIKKCNIIKSQLFTEDYEYKLKKILRKLRFGEANNSFAINNVKITAETD